MKEGYPLQWPESWQRTLNNRRQYARFDTTFAKARDSVLNEIRLLGGRYAIISSNVPLKQDGLPYASYREPDDCGVAVYFELYGEEQCIPCDKWRKVVDNIQAVNKTIGALRGLERWGAKEMVTAAFQGFKALPPPDGTETMGEIKLSWYKILDCSEFADKDEIKRAYKKKLMIVHPDQGGTQREFQIVQQAYNEVMRGK